MSEEAEPAAQVRNWDTNTMPWEIRHIEELDGDLAAKQLVEDPDMGDVGAASSGSPRGWR
jgi:hypothetical protein